MYLLLFEVLFLFIIAICYYYYPYCPLPDQGLELLRILAGHLATMPQSAGATEVMPHAAGVLSQSAEVLPRTADAAEVMPRIAGVMPSTTEAAGVMPQNPGVMPQTAGVLPHTAGVVPGITEGPGEMPLTANTAAAGSGEGESASPDNCSALVSATLALLELLPSVCTFNHRSPPWGKAIWLCSENGGFGAGL